MPITIDGDGTITGLSVGGLPDGVVDADMLAANAVTTAKISDSQITNAKLASDQQKALAKAWVNFNGTGTVAIRDSFNVSSITDNGTGDYTVNFTTNLANANFAVAVSGCDSTESEPPSPVNFAVKDFSVSNVQIFMRLGTSSHDTDITTVIVFGD